MQFEVDMSFLNLNNFFGIVELLQIWMLEDFLDGDSLVRVKLQSASYQIKQLLIIRSKNLVFIYSSFGVKNIHQHLVYVHLYRFDFTLAGWARPA